MRWFNGLIEIETGSSSRFSLIGFVLIFSSVRVSDYGIGYYCVVSVRMQNDIVVTRQSSTIALNSFLKENIPCKYTCKYNIPL